MSRLEEWEKGKDKDKDMEEGREYRCKANGKGRWLV